MHKQQVDQAFTRSWSGVGCLVCSLVFCSSQVLTVSLAVILEADFEVAGGHFHVKPVLLMQSYTVKTLVYVQIWLHVTVLKHVVDPWLIDACWTALSLLLHIHIQEMLWFPVYATQHYHFYSKCRAVLWMERPVYFLLVCTIEGIFSAFRKLVAKDQDFRLYVQLQVLYLVCYDLLAQYAMQIVTSECNVVQTKLIASHYVFSFMSVEQCTDRIKCRFVLLGRALTLTGYCFSPELMSACDAFLFGILLRSHVNLPAFCKRLCIGEMLQNTSCCLDAFFKFLLCKALFINWPPSCCSQYLSWIF